MISSKNFVPTLSLLLTILTSSFSSSLYAASETIKFGILSIAPPSRIHSQWQPFIEYVSKEIGQPIEIVIPRGFKKMKNEAAKGNVDLFYINSRVFYRLKHNKQAFGVLQMQNLEGNITSHSEIYARHDSGINNLDDLKGKTIAYVSPMGAGGYLAPRAKLMSKGIKSGEVVKEVFTKNLSNSIHKVILGDLNAGTMCGVNFKLMSKRVDSGELVIIDVSDEYPENVIAARSNLSKELTSKFQKIVTNMVNTEKGRKILDKMSDMKITKFLPYDPKVEQLTRDLLKQAKLKP